MLYMEAERGHFDFGLMTCSGANLKQWRMVNKRDKRGVFAPFVLLSPRFLKNRWGYCIRLRPSVRPSVTPSL